MGDWEGDLIEGKKGTGYFLTLTERVSRFTIAEKLPTKEAVIVSKKTSKKLRKIKDRINSITYDNGREFYDFKRVEKALDTTVYFADTYSSWQRGTNEHANGMLRRFFPKGTDFSNITDRQLKDAVDKINNRPRKILNYHTSAEIFYGESGALAM
jgi:IS30 family transposase